jgi:hypothetical protein
LVLRFTSRVSQGHITTASRPALTYGRQAGYGHLRSVASMTRLTGYPSFVDAAHGRWAPPLLT